MLFRQRSQNVFAQIQKNFRTKSKNFFDFFQFFSQNFPLAACNAILEALQKMFRSESEIFSLKVRKTLRYYKTFQFFPKMFVKYNPKF